MKLLLIDQDSHSLEKIQTSLTRANYQVLIAADSDIGLRLARADQPDLIIMDLMLTGLDGLEVVDIPGRHFAVERRFEHSVFQLVLGVCDSGF